MPKRKKSRLSSRTKCQRDRASQKASQGLPNKDDPNHDSESSEPPHKAPLIDFIGTAESGTAESTTVADDLSANFHGFKTQQVNLLQKV